MNEVKTLSEQQRELIATIHKELKSLRLSIRDVVELFNLKRNGKYVMPVATLQEEGDTTLTINGGKIKLYETSKLYKLANLLRYYEESEMFEHYKTVMYRIYSLNRRLARIVDPNAIIPDVSYFYYKAEFRMNTDANMFRHIHRTLINKLETLISK